MSYKYFVSESKGQNKTLKMSDTKKDNSGLATKEADERFRALFKDFLKNDHHTFVVQKAEKLASALYMVTGFIPGDDPLRTRLRVCAVDLISTSADPSKARDVRYQEGFASRCLEIASILKLAERAGFISGMNSQVLCDEYAELASFVKNHHEKVFGVVHFSVAGEDDHEAGGHARAAAGAAQGSLKDTSSKTQRKRGLQSKRQNNRRDMILRLLDKKDKISIKDAFSAVEGCGEKTIQRELSTLVQEGVLLKEGKRRWTTYRKA